jgi:hypothetical protein
MAQKNGQETDLKLFVFYWSNARMGITDASGVTFYPPQKRTIAARSEREARQMFNRDERQQRRALRRQSRLSHGKLQKIAAIIFFKDGLTVKEFPIRLGLSV